MIKYILGIDGGGTKTEAVILDIEGKVAGTGTAGGSNTNFISRREAAEAFKQAISGAFEAASVTAKDIGCAGCTFWTVANEVFDELRIPVQPKSFSEHAVAFERAGIEELRGIAIIAGTGSSCGGFSDGGQRFTVGGWGPLLGDEGSAYDIGLRGIKRALWSAEGRLPDTLLVDAVRSYFGIEHAKGAIGKLCDTKINQSLVAGFAMEVSKAAGMGDEAAIQIIEEAGEMLGEMAAFVARQIFTENDGFPVVLAGGVFNMGRLVLDPIRAVILPQFPKAKALIAKMKPGEAVARLAYKKCFGG